MNEFEYYTDLYNSDHEVIVPASLGPVISVREAMGRVVAETESGVPFIVPFPNREDQEND